MQELLTNLQNYENTWQQLVAVFLASAVPFIESYGASFVGVVLGFPLFVAVPVAIAGNTLSMALVVLFGDRINQWRVRRAEAKGKDLSASRKSVKLKKAFDKWGIPGVSLLGQTILPSQITSMAMVTFGANRSKVIFWQIISIILWGLTFGLLAHFGIQMF